MAAPKLTVGPRVCDWSCQGCGTVAKFWEDLEHGKGCPVDPKNNANKIEQAIDEAYERNR